MIRRRYVRARDVLAGDVVCEADSTGGHRVKDNALSAMAKGDYRMISFEDGQFILVPEEWRVLIYREGKL